MNLNEGRYFNRIAEKTGITRDILEDIWNECVSFYERKGQKSKSRKGFWKDVRNLFETKIKEIDIMEAKRIMKERNGLRKNIEGLLDNLARDDYTTAQKNLRKSVGNCFKTMINSRAEAYLKEKGSEVKERAKEV